MSVSAAPPLLLASTSPQRRAILQQLGIPFDVVAPRLRGARPARRGPGRSSSRRHARGKAQLGARGRGGPARCSASTRRSCSAAASTRSPRTRPTRSGCSTSCPGETHAVVSGLCLLTPEWEVVEAAATRVTFRDARRRATSPRTSRRGEWEGRAGGVRDPGPRRRARRAGRGRLPQRRRPAGVAAGAAAGRAFPRRVRLRAEPGRCSVVWDAAGRDPSRGLTPGDARSGRSSQSHAGLDERRIRSTRAVERPPELTQRPARIEERRRARLPEHRRQAAPPPLRRPLHHPRPLRVQHDVAPDLEAVLVGARRSPSETAPGRDDPPSRGGGCTPAHSAHSAAASRATASRPARPSRDGRDSSSGSTR